MTTTQVMATRRRIGAGIVGVAALVLVAVGCGSDTESSDIVAGSSSTTAASTTTIATTAPSTTIIEPGGPSTIATTSTTAAPPSPPRSAADTTISIDALGPLALGMTRADVAALGLGVGEFGCGNLRSVTGGAGELTGAFDDGGVVTAASTGDAAFETLSGIRVGSTTADLQAAYGANLVSTSYEGNVGPASAFQLRSEPSIAADRFVWFTMYEGKVARIALLSGSSTPGSILC